MKGERLVAGLRCGEVLEELSDYLDDQLVPERRAQIDAHLRGCAVCERFGGEFGRALAVLRRTLTEAEPLDDDLADRLRNHLRDHMQS